MSVAAGRRGGKGIQPLAHSKKGGAQHNTLYCGVLWCTSTTAAVRLALMALRRPSSVAGNTSRAGDATVNRLRARRQGRGHKQSLPTGRQ